MGLSFLIFSQLFRYIAAFRLWWVPIRWIILANRCLNSNVTILSVTSLNFREKVIWRHGSLKCSPPLFHSNHCLWHGHGLHLANKPPCHASRRQLGDEWYFEWKFHSGRWNHRSCLGSGDCDTLLSAVRNRQVRRGSSISVTFNAVKFPFRLFSVSTKSLRTPPRSKFDLPVKLVGHKSSQGIGLAVAPTGGALFFSPVRESALVKWTPSTNNNEYVMQFYILYKHEVDIFIVFLRP
jgi:Major royal jelly protein